MTIIYLDDITIYDLFEALIEEIELLVDGAIEEPIHVQVDILLLVVLCDWYVDSIFLHDVLEHTLSSLVYVSPHISYWMEKFKQKLSSTSICSY